jgi:integrase
VDLYVFRPIGEMPVSEVTHADIVELLRPIWGKKQDLAKRLLQRMKNVFTMAISRGWREMHSPCEGVTQELGRQRRVVKNYPALPYAEVRDFIKILRAGASDDVTKLAFERLILTATRSKETRLAVWPEIDVNSSWIIPPERMKKRRKQHIVPLSKRCLEIMRQARALNRDANLLFPGDGTRRAVSERAFTTVLSSLGLSGKVTAHGFRSTFRVWEAEADGDSARNCRGGAVSRHTESG